MYEVPVVFELNRCPWMWRSMTLSIWMKIGRWTYLANINMSAQIDAFRQSHLFPMHFVTDECTSMSRYAHSITPLNFQITAMCKSNTGFKINKMIEHLDWTASLSLYLRGSNSSTKLKWIHLRHNIGDQGEEYINVIVAGGYNINTQITLSSW